MPMKHKDVIQLKTQRNSWSPTTAVSFSVPDTVTALVSSGTDMLFPHIHCTRCWEIRNNKCQWNKKYMDVKMDLIYHLPN